MKSLKIDHIISQEEIKQILCPVFRDATHPILKIVEDLTRLKLEQSEHSLQYTEFILVTLRNWLKRDIPLQGSSAGSAIQEESRALVRKRELAILGKAWTPKKLRKAQEELVALI